MNLNDVLNRLAARQDLPADEAAVVLEAIIAGQVSEAQIAAFLFGMRAKGETVAELAAFVRVMRGAMVRVEVDAIGAVDVCGTGGDHSGTFNISTTVAFVVAGAGVPVLKHGNRSISSLSGSADVLEALGANAMLDADQAARVFNETGITFLFAPLFHPAMKAVGPVRRALGIRTFFNILGPMLNPAGVTRQVIGAFNRETAETIAQVLAHFPNEGITTVYAHDGLDELSTSANTEVTEVKGPLIHSSYRLYATEFGLHPPEEGALAGGDAAENARILRDILDGKGSAAQTDIVAWNAAMALRTAGKAADLTEGLDLARESIRSGAARRKLEAFIVASRTT